MAAKLVGLVICVMLVGCTPAEKSYYSDFESKHHITLYSGGAKIGEWTSESNVEWTAQQTGCFFTDSATGLPVRINGTIIVERLNDASKRPANRR